MNKNKPLIFIFCLLFCLHSRGQSGNTEKDVKDFVTKSYIHGLPYQKAKLLGADALPVLEKLLYDPAYADYRANIVSCIGIAGKAKGFPVLKEYLYKQKGEMEYSTLMSVLITLPSLGHAVRDGSKEAYTLLVKLANPDNWSSTGLNFSYRNYKGQSMGVLISKLAVQGLGVSGTPATLQLLTEMSNPRDEKYKAVLQNDIKDALILNKQIQAEGADKAFEKEVMQ